MAHILVSFSTDTMLIYYDLKNGHAVHGTSRPYTPQNTKCFVSEHGDLYEALRNIGASSALANL